MFPLLGTPTSEISHASELKTPPLPEYMKLVWESKSLSSPPPALMKMRPYGPSTSVFSMRIDVPAPGVEHPQPFLVPEPE